MSSVTSKKPCAPLPFACTTRSGTRSRLKCCIFWTRWASCSSVGPFGPAVSECSSLGTGTPESVVVVGGRLSSVTGGLLGLGSFGEGRVRDVVAEVGTHVARDLRVEDVDVHRPEGRVGLEAHAVGERVDDARLEAGARMGGDDLIANRCGQVIEPEAEDVELDAGRHQLHLGLHV